jgi:hypothetical protein
MFGESIIYSIGTALNRAHDNDIMVEILVEGQWMRGHVVGVDGHGAVLCSDDNLEHAVVRMEAISAVRIFTAPPGRTPLPAGAAVMPGPRNPSQ